MRAHDTAIETVKALPPVGVAGLTVFGVTIADWALILTIIYTVFLLIDKLPTVIRRLAQAWRWAKDKYNGRIK